MTREAKSPFKDDIRSFLKRRQMSMRALSIEAGLHPDTVKGILHGKSEHSREDTMAAVRKAMQAVTAGKDIPAETQPPERIIAGYGERLGAARQKLRIEIPMLAAQIGVEPNRIRLWEKAELPPDFYSLARLSLLGISADWILTGRCGRSSDEDSVAAGAAEDTWLAIYRRGVELGRAEILLKVAESVIGAPLPPAA